MRRSLPRRGTGVALAALAALAAMGPRPVGAQQPGTIQMERYQLPNGLTVVLAPDHSAQVAAVSVWYDVGSRNERASRSGFAHLFEHMMFQGSANVRKGEHFQLMERAGASPYNASTTEDRTNYYQAVPSNRLNLALWLEADRMRSLAVTQENLDNQREAVKEERRLRVDNQAYARVFFEDSYAAFDSATCFPYAHSIIGSMDDLNAAKVEDVKQFFDLYYAPNNATLVITGDFAPAGAKALVEQYFGDIPRAQTPPPVQCEQPFSPGLVRKRIQDPKATLPAVVHIYRVPAYDDADMPALELLSTILGQGESSRFNRTLVREQRAAVGAQVLLNPFGPRRGPGVFMTLGIANQGVHVDSLDARVAAEVARVSAEGVTAEELTKAQNTFRATLINERQQMLNVAEAIHRAKMFLGSPEAVNSELERYMTVTAEDIRRVAAKYLVPANAYIIILTAENVTS